MGKEFSVNRYELTWTSVAAVTADAEPDTDTKIDVGTAKSITVQLDTTPAASLSTDNDLNIESSPDGTNWDTVAYAEAITSLGTDALKTVAITPGIGFIRLRLDNNHASLAAAPVARVVVRR